MNTEKGYNVFQTPQNKGFQLFFTDKNETILAMKYAKQFNKYNKNISSLMAIDLIKDDHFSSTLHFGKKVEYHPDKVFFDIDLSQAYTTWLLAYNRRILGYKVGGSKEYYQRNDYFKYNRKNNGIEVYRIKFAVKTEGLKNSRIYRHWVAKTLEIKKLVMTSKEIGGIISIPNVNDMPNRFLEDVQAYDEYEVEIAGVIKTSGVNSVYINEDRIVEALKIKNTPNHPLAKEHKLMLNSATGYLAIADKVMYYAMVNHVKGEVIKLIDKLEKYNKSMIDDIDKIDIVAANTDGITVYADKTFEMWLTSFIEYEINQYTPFKFRIKDIYNFSEAHFTENDIRKKEENG